MEDATGGNGSGEAPNAYYRLRKEWATAALFALDHCARDDAIHICETILAENITDGPVLGDPFGTLTGDALFWADCAPVPELVAYGTAALGRLRQRPLGIVTRKKLLADLWQAFGSEDRQAFLARVDPQGRFLRRNEEAA